jgi:RNA polymerase sigma-70 factor (ECF subfamily)
VELVYIRPITCALSMDPDIRITRAQKLDGQALAEIHDQYYPEVYRYVRYRLDDEQLVEDITSEVFLRLLEVFSKKPGSIREIKPWLMGTASNLVFDHLRLKYRRGAEDLEDHEDLPDEHLTEDVVDQTLRDGVLREVFKELTEDQQHVLSLRFSQGLSVDETARTVHKSVNAVKVLQFRAMATLRRLLERRRDL